MSTTDRYIAPGWATRHLFNRGVRRLTRMGLSLAGSRELRVRGRNSGEWRSTPVNLLPLDGERYLVAPRGTTQWVRNLRAAGSGEFADRPSGRGVRSPGTARRGEAARVA